MVSVSTIGKLLHIYSFLVNSALSLGILTLLLLFFFGTTIFFEVVFLHQEDLANGLSAGKQETEA